MKMQIVRILLMLAVTFDVVCAGGNIETFTKLKTVYFQQTLLRDAVQYLESVSGYSINLSDEVSHLPDLWVNYKGDGKSLDVVLDDIMLFVKKEHGVLLKWRLLGKKKIIVEHEGVGH